MEILIVLAIVIVVLSGLASALVLRSRAQRTMPTPTRRGEALEPPATEPRTAATPPTVPPAGDLDVDIAVDLPEPAVESLPEPGVAPSFRDRLASARGVFSGALGSIRSRGGIDSEAWDELEEALLLADVGIGPTTELLDGVRARVKERAVTDVDGLLAAVRAEMVDRLSLPTELEFADESPTIWLFVGVNGVGKTTSIGKIGHRLTQDGQQVLMAAGDTFRAAAAEQLATWAQRCGAEFVRGAEGGDPSSVIFDGIARGAAIGSDVVLCDTAGRLHTKSNLMDELSKVRRVADKGAGHVTEVLLVIDATTGQNGLVQARQFAEATEVTGVVLTKLDGSAKGGIVFAIASELKIPVKLVGLGEAATDLIDFDAEAFVDALFAEN